MENGNNTMMDAINMKVFYSFSTVQKLIGDKTQNVLIFLAFGCIFAEYFGGFDLPVTEIILVYGVTFMLYELFKWRIRAIIKKYENGE